MKKISFALVLVLALFALCSCGGGKSTGESVADISREMSATLSPVDFPPPHEQSAKRASTRTNAKLIFFISEN